MAKEIKFETKNRIVIPPGHPSCPEGLFSEEITFPDGLPPVDDIRIEYDASTGTMKFFRTDS